ncbi:MAG: 1-acyl-sn-glycerol-3-phosphate acyltransferase [Saprospiraceae bacterium]|nr:1-acyl-sn-glycerol-3-phosphate acyltransferase [Saprospiraceae bacterium]
MLYTLLRPVTRWAFLAFFRKIHLTGLDQIPRDTPLIFTANHPTAFVEPCFLACFGPRELHFMARGDVFMSPLVRWLLRQVHLIPIYRFHDGFSALRQNEASFSVAKRILSKGGAILIMAEGRMKHEKRLRPLQKGAARIGLGAMDEYQLKDVMIQPVGINYTYAERSRKEIMVDFAEPFSLAPYLEGFQDQPNQTLSKVTDRIRVALEKRVVHIDNPDDEVLAEWILQLVRIRTRKILPIVEHDPQVLHAEYEAMVKLNQLNVLTKERLQEEFTPYFLQLEENQIEDEVVALSPRITMVDQLVWMPILFSHWLIYICHWPPVQLGRWLTRRTVRIIEFQSSILLGSIMMGWAFWWMGWSAVISTVNWRYGLIFLILFPISAGWSVWSGEWLKRFRQAKQWQKLDADLRQKLGSVREVMVELWRSIQISQK